MKVFASVGFALALAAAGAQAQGSAGGISVSTDPARIAAVEQMARSMQARSGMPATSGPVHATTASGWAYVSGGVATQGRHAMMAERDRYNLWVATVAKPSGAYLADVALRIEDAKDPSKMLDARMSGPWLMVALPPGRYDIVGTYRAAAGAQPQTLTRQVDIGASGHRQAILRFDSPADVAPGHASGGNPFASAMASS